MRTAWGRGTVGAAVPGQGGAKGGMLLSFGGGVSPGTPQENINALLKAAHKWSKSVTIMAKAKAGEGHGVELSGVG